MKTLFTLMAAMLLTSGFAFAQNMATQPAKPDSTRSTEVQRETSVDSSAGKVYQTTTQRVIETTTRVDPSTGQVIRTSEVTTTANGGDVTPRTNLFIVSPFKFITLYNIGYLHLVSNHWALGGSIQVPTTLFLTNTTGVGINAEARYYPVSTNMKGAYLAPVISAGSYHSDDANSSYVDPNGTLISQRGGDYRPATVGLYVGWQWFLGDNFAMGLALGGDYFFYPFGGINVNQKVTDSYGESYYNGVLYPIAFHGLTPGLRFDIGFGW